MALVTVASMPRELPDLTDAEKATFLREARVTKAKPAGSGVTGSWRVTLERDGMSHDASFQAVDERAVKKNLGGGRFEVDFVDSYRYNIAGYRLAALLGLGDMVPVSVERHWHGKNGAMTWWVDDVWMDENELMERGLHVPDEGRWSAQIYKVRVFGQLIFDTDRNRGNVLVTKNWRIWMIDFTRAFRKWKRLQSVEALHRCSRDLLEALRALTPEALEAAMDGMLTDAEMEGVLARRDLLVEHFESLIRERGEEAVLY